MEGKVKWFNIESCFGLLEAKDGAEVFVYYKDFSGHSDRSLQEGQRVIMNVIAE